MGWREDIEAAKDQPFVFQDPILGINENISNNTNPLTQSVTGQSTVDVPIYQSDIIRRLPNELNPEAQLRLALEMFMNIDSAYSDVSEILDEDGTVNQDTFMQAIQTTLGFAATAGPTGLNTTTKYLDILTGASSSTNPDGSPVSVEQLLSQIAEQDQGSSFPFSNLVIQEMLDRGLVNVLGRGANKSEQKAFTEMILQMGDSVRTTDLVLEAEQFGRASRPNESGAYSLVNAANSVMQVLGMGG